MTAHLKARHIGFGKITLGKVAIYMALILWALTTLFPFVWVINNSFKDSSLVISDSFSLVTKSVYSYDRWGQVVRETILLDEYGRERYDRHMINETGRILTQGEAVVPTLTLDNPFTRLMGGGTTSEPSESDAWPAYDTKHGKIMYDLDSPPVRLSPTLKNYENAFTNRNINILTGYKNSLIISGTVMVMVMLLATMMAFAITRYKFFGKGAVRSMIVAALMFPAFSTIVPVYRMLAQAGLFDTRTGVILVQTAGNLAFACTVMIGFVATLPYELEEAAFMEGSGVFRIFWRIILPLSRPALATVAIFTFIWSYNDLFVQMVLLRTRALMPVCAILREISSQYGTDFGLMAAAVAIVVIPVLVLYVVLQKNIIKGLTAGAVKG